MHAHSVARATVSRARSVAECIEEKAAFAAKGKEEVRQWDGQIAEERRQTMEARKQQALEIKKSELGKVEEGKRYVLDGNTKAVKQVQSLEQKWKQMSRQQRDAFNARSAQNHASADATNEHMRQARKDLIAKNHASVIAERDLKTEHAATLFERHKKAETAKRTIRDAVFSARFVSNEKTKVGILLPCNAKGSIHSAVLHECLICSQLPPRAYHILRKVRSYTHRARAFCMCIVHAASGYARLQVEGIDRTLTRADRHRARAYRRAATSFAIALPHVRLEE